MPNLRPEIQRLAEEFAGAVLKSLHGASLADLAGIALPKATASRERPASAASRGSRARPVRRGGRRNADAIASTLEAILAALAKAPSEGLTNEQLQKAIGLQKGDLVVPLARGLAGKRLRKTGERRATRYRAA